MRGHPRRSGRLSDLYMIVLSWFTFHPGDSPEGIAQALGADVDEIAKLCADLAAAVYIEPTTRHRDAGAGTEPSCGSPQTAGKAPCEVSGTGIRATGWTTGGKGYSAP